MALQAFKTWEGDVYLGTNRLIRIQEATLNVSRNPEPYYEAGSIDPTDIRGGNKTVSGSIKRGIVNGELISQVIGSKSQSDSTWTISSSDLLYPATTVTDESISPDGSTTLFQLDHAPILRGTFTLKSGGTAWGTEGVDYTLDYAYGVLVFSVPQAADTWTVDYEYGESITIRLVLQVGAGNQQRTDVVLRGCELGTWSMTLGSDGGYVAENVDFTGETVDGLYVGAPDNGV